MVWVISLSVAKSFAISAISCLDIDANSLSVNSTLTMMVSWMIWVKMMVRFITLGFLVVGSSTNIVEKIKPPNLFQKKEGRLPLL